MRKLFAKLATVPFEVRMIVLLLTLCLVVWSTSGDPMFNQWRRDGRVRASTAELPREWIIRDSANKKLDRTAHRLGTCVVIRFADQSELSGKSQSFPDIIRCLNTSQGRYDTLIIMRDFAPNDGSHEQFVNDAESLMRDLKKSFVVTNPVGAHGVFGEEVASCLGEIRIDNRPF